MEFLHSQSYLTMFKKVLVELREKSYGQKSNHGQKQQKKLVVSSLVGLL